MSHYVKCLLLHFLLPRVSSLPPLLASMVGGIQIQGQDVCRGVEDVQTETCGEELLVDFYSLSYSYPCLCDSLIVSTCSQLAFGLVSVLSVCRFVVSPTLISPTLLLSLWTRVCFQVLIHVSVVVS